MNNKDSLFYDKISVESVSTDNTRQQRRYDYQEEINYDDDQKKEIVIINYEKRVWCNDFTDEDIRMENGYIVINNIPSLFKMSKTGLKEGDRIFEINGISVNDLPLSEILNLINNKDCEIKLERKLNVQRYSVYKYLGKDLLPYCLKKENGNPTDYIVIEDVPLFSAARRAGLKKGDKIISIGGYSTRGMDIYEFLEFLNNDAFEYDIEVIREEEEETGAVNSPFISIFKLIYQRNLILKKYPFLEEDCPVFSEYLVGKVVEKPYTNDKHISQGCTFIGSDTLLTYYRKNKKKSLILRIDEDGSYKYYEYPSDHACAIVCHEESGTIYASGDLDTNEIYIYKNDEMVSGEFLGGQPIELGTNTEYLSINGDKLYVGNFVTSDTIIEGKETQKLFEYQLDSNGNIIEGSEKEIDLSSLESALPELSYPIVKDDGTVISDYGVAGIQGMCVYTYENQDYYIFGCGGGRRNNSMIYVMTLNEQGDFELVSNFVAPAMIEQLSITSDNHLGMVFESDSDYYANANERNPGNYNSINQVSDVLFVDIDRIIEEKPRTQKSDMYTTEYLEEVREGN